MAASVWSESAAAAGCACGCASVAVLFRGGAAKAEPALDMQSAAAATMAIEKLANEIFMAPFLIPLRKKFTCAPPRDHEPAEAGSAACRWMFLSSELPFP